MINDKQKRKQAPKPRLVFSDVLAALWRWLIVVPVTGILRVGRWTARQAWRGTKWSVRFAWDVTKWGANLAWQGVKLPFRFLSWLFSYGNLPAFENVYQREAYLRIKRRYRRHFWRNLHTVGFLGINGVLLLQLFFQRLQLERSIGYSFFNNSLYGTATFIFFWTLIFLAHFALVRSKDNEEEALNASLEQYRGFTPPEKRKHKEYEEVDEYSDDQAYYVNDVSRLVEQPVYEEQEWQEHSSPQRRSKSRR